MSVELASSPLGADSAAGAASIDRDELLRAMERPAEALPRAMEIVALHLVADIHLEWNAERVGISKRTAYRDLQEGRKALARELRSGHA